MEKFKNAFYLFLPLILGSLVGFIIGNNIDYTTLNRPVMSPPKILFPIIWTIIYLLMGLSYFLIKNNNKDTKTINIVYYLQLFFNLLWSIIFFTLKLRFVAVIWIIILDVLVIYMIYLFYKQIKLSAYLNILYLVWILFATYLTIGIYILN